MFFTENQQPVTSFSVTSSVLFSFSSKKGFRETTEVTLQWILRRQAGTTATGWRRRWRFGREEAIGSSVSQSFGVRRIGRQSASKQTRWWLTMMMIFSYEKTEILLLAHWTYAVRSLSWQFVDSFALGWHKLTLSVFSPGHYLPWCWTVWYLWCLCSSGQFRSLNRI